MMMMAAVVAVAVVGDPAYRRHRTRRRPWLLVLIYVMDPRAVSMKGVSGDGSLFR